jgi:hypothetical protein
MKNGNVYVVGGVAAGSAVLGCIAGYLFASHQLRERADRDVADLREHYAIREANLEEQFRADVETLNRISPVAREPELQPADTGIRHDPRPFVASPGRIDPLLGLDEEDYEDDAIRDFDDDEAVGEAEEVAGSDDRRADDPVGRPYLISEERFSEECSDYQKLTIRYFKGDGVLCDDKDAPMPDIRSTVGPEAIEALMSGAYGLLELVYVRNDKLQIDFEVCLDHGAFTEVVLGYGTAHPKPLRILPGEG